MVEKGEGLPARFRNQPCVQLPGLPRAFVNERHPSYPSYPNPQPVYSSAKKRWGRLVASRNRVGVEWRQALAELLVCLDIAGMQPTGVMAKPQALHLFSREFLLLIFCLVGFNFRKKGNFA